MTTYTKTFGVTTVGLGIYGFLATLVTGRTLPGAGRETKKLGLGVWQEIAKFLLLASSVPTVQTHIVAISL